MFDLYVSYNKTYNQLAVLPQSGGTEFDTAGSVIMYRFLWGLYTFPCAVSHDDVIKWKHFPRYWPFVRGIHRSPVNSAHKGQWRGALMFPLICVWINGWVNNREAGDLRRTQAHYDVIVMIKMYLCVYVYMKIDVNAVYRGNFLSRNKQDPFHSQNDPFGIRLYLSCIRVHVFSGWAECIKMNISWFELFMKCFRGLADWKATTKEVYKLHHNYITFHICIETMHGSRIKRSYSSAFCFRWQGWTVLDCFMSSFTKHTKFPNSMRNFFEISIT